MQGQLHSRIPQPWPHCSPHLSTSLPGRPSRRHGSASAGSASRLRWGNYCWCTPLEYALSSTHVHACMLSWWTQPAVSLW